MDSNNKKKEDRRSREEKDSEVEWSLNILYTTEGVYMCRDIVFAKEHPRRRVGIFSDWDATKLRVY